MNKEVRLKISFEITSAIAEAKEYGIFWGIVGLIIGISLNFCCGIYPITPTFPLIAGILGTIIGYKASFWRKESLAKKVTSLLKSLTKPGFLEGEKLEDYLIRDDDTGKYHYIKKPPIVNKIGRHPLFNPDLYYDKKTEYLLLSSSIENLIVDGRSASCEIIFKAEMKIPLKIEVLLKEKKYLSALDIMEDNCEKYLKSIEEAIQIEWDDIKKKIFSKLTIGKDKETKDWQLHKLPEKALSKLIVNNQSSQSLYEHYLLLFALMAKKYLDVEISKSISKSIPTIAQLEAEILKGVRAIEVIEDRSDLPQLPTTQPTVEKSAKVIHLFQEDDSPPISIQETN